MTRQLAFDLPVTDAVTRADFFASPANAAGLQAIDHPDLWPGGRMLLVGPAGSGKTHLAHIWAETVSAQLVSVAELDQALISDQMALVVDDAHLVAGQAEATLFHLHNRLAQGGTLLLTAPTPPRDWGLRLPDLLSRMQAMALTRLDPPDDALLSAVLVKLFADRQIAVQPTLIAFLVTRMERSIAAARALVAMLDAKALAAGRPVTRALAAEVLDSAAGE